MLRSCAYPSSPLSPLWPSPRRDDDTRAALAAQGQALDIGDAMEFPRDGVHSGLTGSFMSAPIESVEEGGEVLPAVAYSWGLFVVHSSSAPTVIQFSPPRDAAMPSPGHPSPHPPSVAERGGHPRQIHPLSSPGRTG